MIGAQYFDLGLVVNAEFIWIAMQIVDLKPIHYEIFSLSHCVIQFCKEVATV